MKLAVLSLTLLLASCTALDNLLGDVWIGNGQDTSQTWVVRLEASTVGDKLIGQYFAGRSTIPTAPSGTFEGTLGPNKTIVAEIKPNTNCTLSFAGTITNQRLFGDYIPSTGCGLIRAGTWDLLKQ
jgi:hypothetical protein